MLSKIDLCFDMGGCPNDCSHCWIKTSGRGHVKAEVVQKITESFKPLTKAIGVYSWYLEPDYLPDYKNLWSLEQRLSTHPHEHFELLSDWRLYRDDDYLQWAYEIGVRKCQLTFFGMDETTNAMTGRSNAFKELLAVTDKLMAVGIAPRFQIFAYDFNIEEIQAFEALILELALEKKCQERGLTFERFVHTGSCVGRASDLYDKWLTEDRMGELPESLLEASKDHYQTQDLRGIFGVPEGELYQDLVSKDEIQPIVIEDVILYIDGHEDVYPHFAVHQPWWCLGNLKEKSPEQILQDYLKDGTLGQWVRKNVTLSQMVKRFGNPESRRMFHREDYIEYITEEYLQWYSQNLEQ